MCYTVACRKYIEKMLLKTEENRRCFAHAVNQALVTVWNQMLQSRSTPFSDLSSSPPLCSPSDSSPPPPTLSSLARNMASQAPTNRHTIILMQTSQSRSSRTFMNYDSISKAIDGLCSFYERKIREINPTIQHIAYDIADLYNFIDGLADLSALVFDHNIQAFLPYDRQWIKQKAFQHLKRLASQKHG